MRLLRAGLLACLLAALLTAAVLGDYGRDRYVIRWFPGTGIAGKVDVWGPAPARVTIANQANNAIASAEVWQDGSFIAPLPPGRYWLEVPNDSRVVPVEVPTGQCVDVILDYRIPGIVLTIPG